MHTETNFDAIQNIWVGFKENKDNFLCLFGEN